MHVIAFLCCRDSNAHGGGSGRSGRVNIGRSIAALHRHIASKDRPFLPRIEATHYPYAVAGEQLDLTGQIIRDADLAQSLSPVWIQQVVIGLARERRISPL